MSVARCSGPKQTNERCTHRRNQNNCRKNKMTQPTSITKKRAVCIQVLNAGLIESARSLELQLVKQKVTCLFSFFGDAMRCSDLERNSSEATVDHPASVENLAPEPLNRIVTMCDRLRTGTL